jgi:hypothetical protein
MDANDKKIMSKQSRHLGKIGAQLKENDKTVKKIEERCDVEIAPRYP